MWPSWVFGSSGAAQLPPQMPIRAQKGPIRAQNSPWDIGLLAGHFGWSCQDQESSGGELAVSEALVVEYKDPKYLVGND